MSRPTREEERESAPAADDSFDGGASRRLEMATAGKQSHTPRL